MILAESVAVPSGGDWKGFAVVCLFGLFAIEKVVSILRGLRREPEKREVSFSEEYASKTDFQTLKQVVEKQESYGAERRKAIYRMIDEKAEKTDANIDALRKEMKDDFQGVHDRVTTVVDRLSGLAGEIKRALE